MRRPELLPPVRAAPARRAVISTLTSIGCLGLLLSPSLGAQTDRSGPAITAAAPAEEGASGEQQTRTRKRLLHLRHGGVLRATSRRTEQGWEWRRNGGEWQQLPAAAVSHALLESDVEREARQRRSAARREGDHARVDVATWMAEQGLLTEAFREVDHILEASPDHAAVREALRAPAFAVGLPPVDGPIEERPAAVERLLDFTAHSTPALRELAVNALQHAQLTAEDLRPRLARDLRAPEPGRRAFAALALRRLYPDAPPAELTRRAVLDRAPEVRQQAALALRDANDENLIHPLVDVLHSDSSTVRTHAAQALATIGAAAAVEPLVTHFLALPASGAAHTPRGSVFVGTQRAYVQGYDGNVATDAAIADPIIGVVQSGATLDVEVLGVSPRALAAERKALRSSLERITGAQPGSSRGAWQRWWNDHRDQWPAYRGPTDAGADVPEPDRGDEDDEDSAAGPKRW